MTNKRPLSIVSLLAQNSLASSIQRHGQDQEQLKKLILEKYPLFFTEQGCTAVEQEDSILYCYFESASALSLARFLEMPLLSQLRSTPAGHHLRKVLFKITHSPSVK
jgi:hypothetical protein